MAVLSLIAGLFGCAKAQKHSSGDVCGVSLSCGGMNFSENYNFGLREKNGEWLLSAEYVPQSREDTVCFEDVPVSQKDADEILRIIDEQRLVAFAENYCEKEEKFFADDAESIVFSLKFKDGEAAFAKESPSAELKEKLCCLAEKYCQ